MRRLSRERRALGELPEPEILPMMNILFMLVLVLMGMSSFFPIGVISVQAPLLASHETTKPEPRSELNLTVMILKTGFNLSVSGNMLKGMNEGPLLPKKRSGYDFMALRNRLTAIKAEHPQDNRIILVADPDIIYDEITHVMDAARPMFTEVAFIPGIIQ